MHYNKEIKTILSVKEIAYISSAIMVYKNNMKGADPKVIKCMDKLVNRLGSVMFFKNKKYSWKEIELENIYFLKMILNQKIVYSKMIYRSKFN